MGHRILALAAWMVLVIGVPSLQAQTVPSMEGQWIYRMEVPGGGEVGCAWYEPDGTLIQLAESTIPLVQGSVSFRYRAQGHWVQRGPRLISTLSQIEGPPLAMGGQQVPLTQIVPMNTPVEGHLTPGTSPDTLSLTIMGITGTMNRTDTCPLGTRDAQAS